MTLSDAAADNFAPMLPIDPFPCLGSYFLIAPNRIRKEKQSRYARPLTATRFARGLGARYSS